MDGFLIGHIALSLMANLFYTQRFDAKNNRGKPVLWGTSLIGFGHLLIKSNSGREVDWLKMGFASRKQALSLYFTCNLDEYAAELKKLGVSFEKFNVKKILAFAAKLI